MAPRRDNQKAVEARERKAQQASQKREAELKAKEEAKWKDAGTKVQQQKDQRKKEAEQKAEEARKRREERQLLERQELATIQGTNKGAGKNNSAAKPKRLTQYQILTNLAKQAATKSSADAISSSPSRIVSTNDEELVPNLNHARRAEAYDAILAGHKIINATGIDQTLQELDLLEEETGKIDMHPERRAKVAFKVFEERESARLRQEFPELKRSQIAERVYKLWQKVPENPLVKD